MTHIIAALPPSDHLEEQTAGLAAVLGDHHLTVVTDPDALEMALPDADILIVTAFFPITAGALAHAPRLKFIQVAGVDADHIDLEAARALRIPVAVVTGANTSSVAEHVVLAILGLLRPVVKAHTGLVAGQWPLSNWMDNSHDLAGKTIGIVGMGRIGQAVAARLLPFEVSLLYADEHALTDVEEDLLGLTRMDLDEVLVHSDIVTIHLPLTEETRGLFDAKRIHRMHPGSYLINSSRGEIVNRDALAQALHGHLAGAAVDVFTPEPPRPDDPLLHLPNVLLTPHGAGVTREAQRRIAQGVVANLVRYLDGHPVADLVVDPSVELEARR